MNQRYEGETRRSRRGKGILTNAPPTRSKLRTPPQDPEFLPYPKSQRGDTQSMVMEPDPQLLQQSDMRKVKMHQDQYKHRIQLDTDITQLRRDMNEQHESLKHTLHNLRLEAKLQRDHT